MLATLPHSPPPNIRILTHFITLSLDHMHMLQFKVEFKSTVPVQVDGEVWPQPPGVMTLERLPEQATMLLSPDKAIYSHALSKKESTKIALMQSISQPNILLSGGISSRRGRSSNTTPPDQEALIISEES